MEYQKRLIAKIVEDEKFEQKQEEYRKKFKVEEEGIINIVKKRNIEIFLNEVKMLSKTAFWILRIILCAIGGISLLYPATRLPLYGLGLDWINQGLELLK